MNRFNVKSLLAAIIGATALPVLAAPLQHFSITELGVFTPTSINNLGQVSGWTNTDLGQAAVLYSGGALNTLGQVPGTSVAYGVNDAGKVVGKYGDQERAFAYAANHVDNIAPTGSTASAINNKGQIAGSYEANGGTHAYVYANNQLRDIDGSQHGGSVANALSDNGTVVGTRWDEEFGERHAFIHANNTTTDISPAVPGTSSAAGVNDQGQVIVNGETAPFAGRKAYLYQNGAATDLGSLEGGDVYANGINNGGAVVGTAAFFNIPTFTMTGGFLWQQGAMVNLNALIDPALGWVITDAYDINDRNQIAVTGCRFDGCQALLLSVSAVPEPQAYAMLVGGLGLVGWAARRRRRPAGAMA